MLERVERIVVVNKGFLSPCDRRTSIGDEGGEQRTIGLQAVGLLNVRGEGRNSGSQSILDVVQVSW